MCEQVSASAGINILALNGTPLWTAVLERAQDDYIVAAVAEAVMNAQATPIIALEAALCALLHLSKAARAYQTLAFEFAATRPTPVTPIFIDTKKD